MTFLTSTFTSASLGCKDVAGGAFVIEKTVHYIDETSLSRDICLRSWKSSYLTC